MPLCPSLLNRVAGTAELCQPECCHPPCCDRGHPVKKEPRHRAGAEFQEREEETPISRAVERSFPWPPDESKNRNRLAAKEGVQDNNQTGSSALWSGQPAHSELLNSFKNLRCGGSRALTAFPLVSRLDVPFGSDQSCA